MLDQDFPRYAGGEFADMDKSDGGLAHALGASNYQVLRANRAHPHWAENLGYTYNHAPCLTYWRGTFYLQYLANPVDEHRGAGVSLLARSLNGMNWEAPKAVFPAMTVPAGRYVGLGGQEVLVPEPREAIMHQRMAFYHAPDGRLLATGFYGHTPAPHLPPWRGLGVGRAVREIYADGSFGPVYFVWVAEGFRGRELPYPPYAQSPDSGFVAACEALLHDPLVTQQWAEEHGVEQEHIRLKAVTGQGKPLQAFCWYHIDEQTIVALWKQAMFGLSRDGGQTFDIRRAPSFATSGGKAWGQKTADGRYAVAYLNSLGSEHRYPLVAVTSEDGLRFDDMAALFYETPPRRYEGLFKDFGPQYIRGICEGHEEYPQDAMWLCHSVNKEDIWVTRVPLPIRRAAPAHVDDDFRDDSPYATDWNVYSPRWAQVEKRVLADGTHCLRLSDRDPVEYARAERMFPASVRARVTVELTSALAYDAPLEIALTDERGTVACLVQMYEGFGLRARHTSVLLDLVAPDCETKWHSLAIEADCYENRYDVYWDGVKVSQTPLVLRQKVNAVSRLVLRTKPAHRAPGMDVRPVGPDLPDSDAPAREERVYFVRRVKTEALS